MLLRELGPFHYEWERDIWAFPYGSYYYRSSQICHRTLRKWFDINKFKPLWARVYTHPAKNRLKVLQQGRANIVIVEDLHKRAIRIVVYEGWTEHPPAPYPYYVEFVQ